MKKGKEILKILVSKALSPRLQQEARRFYVVRQIIRHRGPREPELSVLRFLVCSGDFVADIGANQGVYTMELSHLVGNQGKVYSFEPIQQNYEILESLIRKARLPNVNPFRVALGSHSGQREMVIPDLGGFTGYYVAHIANMEESGQREPVDVVSLDELWKSRTIQGADFIKCDVEGAELEVIRGGLELIQKLRPGWLMEVGRNTSVQLFRLMHSQGYRAFIYQGKLIPTDTYRDKEASNYFFFHLESKMWKRLLLQPTIVGL